MKEDLEDIKALLKKIQDLIDLINEDGTNVRPESYENFKNLIKD